MKEGKVFKRILAIALVVVMTITMMPFGVFAEGEDATTPAEHEHVWSASWTGGTDSTCIEAGQKGYFACTVEGCDAKANASGDVLESIEKPLADHTWNAGEITTQPKCNVKGEKTFTCEVEGCGATRKEDVDALEHNLVDVPKKDATCDKAGYNAYKECDREGCTYVEGYTEIPATGEHVWGTAVTTKEATCVAKGEKVAPCTTDGCTATNKTEIPAVADAHKWDEGTVVVKATCSSKGEKQYTCENEGCSEIKEEGIEVDPTAHAWNDGTVTKEPTCKDKGEKKYSCTNTGCFETKTEELAAVATAHTWNDGEITTPATCVKEGVKTLTCTSCGTTTTEEVAKSTEHTWGNAVIIKEPTCMEKGEKVAPCNVEGCTATNNGEVAVDPDAHSWDEGTVTTAPTCKDKGVKTFSCKNTGCTKTKTEEIAVDANAHVYATTIKTVVATCVTEGSVTKQCACGETKTDVVPKDASNHDWGIYTETKAPTCTEKGEKESACVREGCAEKDVQEIPAKGHKMTKTEAKEATCKDDGNIEFYTCSTCDKYFTDEAGNLEVTQDKTVIKASNEHKFTKYNVIKDATCEANAIEKATCDVCEEATHERAMPGTMIAHTFKDYKSDGNATCKVDGTMTAVCDMCKEAKDTKTEVDSHKTAPHTPDAEGVKCTLCGAELVCLHVYSGEKLITKTPTCTEKGQKAIVCSKCKANKPGSEEEIAATGHAWDEGEVTKPATCKEKGSKKFKCNNKCGETKTEEIAVAPHDYKKEITHATCTEDGYTTFTCAMCGSHYVDDAIKAYGHMFDLYFYDEGSATCYQDGTKTAECANGCGTKNTVADPGSKTDHEMTDFTIITAATCTTDGEEEAKCFYHEKCGYSELVPVDALGHDIPAEFVTITEPTCTEKGLKTKTCTRCPETVASEEIPALGHDIAADYTIDVAATCTTDGKQSKHCSRCDYKDGEVAIPATGHDHKATGEGTTATCTEPGKAVYVCANGCGDTYSEDNVPALGHDYAYVSDNNATCEADGTKTGKCIRCDATNTIADEGSKLGHTLGTPVIEPASEEKGGLITTKCANCDYAEVEEIAMIDGFKLKYETVVYDGKYKRPSLTITDAEGVKLVKGEDYVLDLPAKDECINAGTYTYTVTFIGNYEGEKTLTYKIVPGKTSKIVASTTKQTYITLKWSAVKGADGYRVYVQTSSGGWKKLATVKGKTTYKVTDLKAGTQYSFAVKAFSKSEDGETTIWATDYTTKTLKTLPGKTSKITVKTNKSAVKLTWKEVKSAEGYRVYVKTAKGGWKTVATVKGGKTTYTIKDLKANTTYEYAVKAYYKDGSATVWSNQYTTVKAKTAK